MTATSEAGRGTREERAGADRIEVRDPATGERIGSVPVAGADEVDRAVGAARAARAGWAARPAAERAALLKAAAARVREHLDALAELQTRENGKPLADSRGGVEAAVGAIEQYAELGPLHRGRSLLGSPGATDAMVHEPRGVVALLVPWNDPVAIAAQGIAAALVIGNVAIFKPSERTPLSGERLVELFEAPPGVLQVLHGDARTGRPLVAHPGVDCVVHTGSVETGREVARVCGEQLKKCVVELGGKDALIVDAGVDPAWAAEQAASGAFANAGQICTSVERIYVHEAVAAPFVDELVRRARELRVGPGLAPGTEMGPLIDERQRELVHRHVREAVEAGAEVLAGGELPEGPGFFYPPTVVAGADDDTALMSEETFGPVAAVRVVPSFDAALEAASRTRYGLAASVLTPVAGARRARLPRARRRHGQGQRRLGRRAGRRGRAAPPGGGRGGARPRRTASRGSGWATARSCSTS